MPALYSWGCNMAMTKDETKGVLVYMEQNAGTLRNVGFELLGQGRTLADSLKTELTALIITGENGNKMAKQAIEAGADKVYVIEGVDFARYSTDNYTYAAIEFINSYKPEAVLFGATIDGRDFAPRVAAILQTGLCADCTDLGIDVEKGLVVWTRPTFGGNVMAQIVCPEKRPQMGTVRPKVFKKPEMDASRTGEIITFEVKLPENNNRVEYTGEEVPEGAVCNIEEAEIIVSGGRGIGTPDKFKMIEDLANAFGGVVGASRAAVDSGWIEHLHQVGQSGKTVGPKVYVAVGISGAIQHLAGMNSSDVIIAINKDAEAPIFRVADYGIVGDLNEIIPLLTKEVKKAREA